MFIKLFAHLLLFAHLHQLVPQNLHYPLALIKRKRNKIMFTRFGAGKKKLKAKNIFLLSQFLFILPVCACSRTSTHARKTLGRERKEVKRRRLLFAARLLKRLYRAWQRGPACPSLIALFILCAVQGVSNALGLCVGRETTHHILSSVPSGGLG